MYPIKKGFSLTEITIVISIAGLIATIVFASFSYIRKSQNDKKRITDMKLVELALEIYRANNGNYPANPNSSQTTLGWDTPGNGNGNNPANWDFIQPLISAGLLPAKIMDPTTNDANGNYKYQRFAAGSNGCVSANGDYYVLGVVTLQTVDSETITDDSPGFACSGHDWQLDFAWVTGAYQFK